MLAQSGDGNTSTIRIFTASEPIAGLSNTNTTQVSVYAGFIGSLNFPSGLVPLNPLEIEENLPGGSLVGEFNSTTLAGESIQFALTTGHGDGNNSLFSLDSNGTLRTLESLDFERGSVLSIRIQAKNEDNQSVEQDFSIEVLDDFELEQPSITLADAGNLELLWLEPGTFTMGQPALGDPERNVTLSRGFYLGRHEVTQAQYEIVMTGYGHGANTSPSQWAGNGNRPVENVSYEEAQIFIDLINTQEMNNLPPGWAYALPSEAEWEFACRAGSTTVYSFGDTITSTDANYQASGYSQTQQVGQYAANPWGLYDMHGNVFEWTSDWHSPFDDTPVTNPSGPASGTNRVFRGGSWSSTGANLGSSYRDYNESVFSDPDGEFGFRIALKYVNKAPIELNSTDVLVLTEESPIGTVVGEFNATDPEGGGISYTLLDGDGFALDSNGTLRTTLVFDFEKNASTHSVWVEAKDELNATSDANFTVQLVNDPSSVFTVSGGQLGAPYFQFTNGLGETPDFTTLQLQPGETYEFEADGVSTIHPFMIGTSYGDLDSSLVSGGPLSGTGGRITLTIPSDYWGDLYYFCTNHSAMIQPFQIAQPAVHFVDLNESVEMEMIW